MGTTKQKRVYRKEREKFNEEVREILNLLKKTNKRKVEKMIDALNILNLDNCYEDNIFERTRNSNKTKEDQNYDRLALYIVRKRKEKRYNAKKNIML